MALPGVGRCGRPPIHSPRPSTCTPPPLHRDQLLYQGTTSVVPKKSGAQRLPCCRRPPAEALRAGAGSPTTAQARSLACAHSTVTQFPELPWTPSYVGSAQPRPFRLEGNRLIITATRGLDPGIQQRVLVWERPK
jgi:hypothetical protein